MVTKRISRNEVSCFGCLNRGLHPPTAASHLLSQQQQVHRGPRAMLGGGEGMHAGRVFGAKRHPQGPQVGCPNVLMRPAPPEPSTAHVQK